MSDYGDLPIDTTKLLPHLSTPETDLILGAWWAKMREGGDLDRLFTKDSHSLSALYRMMSPPTTLLYKVKDSEGIWAAFWFTPCLGGCFIGMWLAPKYRNRMDGFKAILEAHHQAFQHYDVVLGVTKQEKMLDETRRLGYDVLGAVPHFWDGGPAWLVVQSREQWWRRTLPRYGRLIGLTHAAEAVEEVMALGPISR